MDITHFADIFLYNVTIKALETLWTTLNYLWCIIFFHLPNTPLWWWLKSPLESMLFCCYQACFLWHHKQSQLTASRRKMPNISPSLWTILLFVDFYAFTAYFMFRLFFISYCMSIVATLYKTIHTISTLNFIYLTFWVSFLYFVSYHHLEGLMEYRHLQRILQPLLHSLSILLKQTIVGKWDKANFSTNFKLR